MSEAPKIDPDLGLNVRANSPKEQISVEDELDAVLVEQRATLTGESQALNSTEAPTTKASKAKAKRQTPFVERLSNALMILFVSGVITFLAGIVAAAAIFLGLLDLHTTWVKDLLHTLKELAKSVSGGSGPADP